MIEVGEIKFFGFVELLERATLLSGIDENRNHNITYKFQLLSVIDFPKEVVPDTFSVKLINFQLTYLYADIHICGSASYLPIHLVFNILCQAKIEVKIFIDFYNHIMDMSIMMLSM